MGSRVGARWTGVGTARKYPTKSTYTPSQQIVARRIVPSSWYPPVRAVPWSVSVRTRSLSVGTRSLSNTRSLQSPARSAQGTRWYAFAVSMYHLWLEHLHTDFIVPLAVLFIVPLCLLVGKTMRMLSGSMADMKTWNRPVLWLAMCGDRELASCDH